MPPDAPGGDGVVATASPVARALLDTLSQGLARVPDLAPDFAISRPVVSQHL
ncbi:MAG: hypothetical protein M0027_18080 [Candidatus Dormibacteraeota bacterium]|nr:hypothetical protein [Candidatus Dormibacteraeota bacterium]